MLNMKSVIEALHGRKSCRAYLDTLIPDETVRAILEAARWAPSGVNHQPAQVAILGPQTRQALSSAFIANFRRGIPPNPDYEPPSKQWADIYKQRRKACGLALYEAISVSLDDKEARSLQWEKNYSFFHAPVAMIVYIDKNMPKSSWIDMGIFIQSVLLATQEFDLACCAQAAFSDYPDIVRQVLGINNVDIVCGIAIGYEDKTAPINSYRTEREDVARFCHWYP